MTLPSLPVFARLSTEFLEDDFFHGLGRVICYRLRWRIQFDSLCVLLSFFLSFFLTVPLFCSVCCLYSVLLYDNFFLEHYYSFISGLFLLIALDMSYFVSPRFLQHLSCLLSLQERILFLLDNEDIPAT